MPEPAASPQLRGFDTVIFDCDSTLSTIEGVDELARMKGRVDEVAALTEAAMAGETPLESVYGRRLAMLTPTEDEVAAVAALYRSNTVTDAREVIQALLAAGKNVFIVSGGLAPAVVPFGKWLGVPAEHIRAVPVDGAADAPLARSDGKPLVIGDLLAEHPGRSMLVGDGASDLEARRVVDLFIGFTGVVERPRVVDEADVLITGESLAPVVGLAVTDAEETSLSNSDHHGIMSESRRRIAAGELIYRQGNHP